jgi:hypothetical protein
MLTVMISGLNGLHPWQVVGTVLLVAFVAAIILVARARWIPS